MSNYDPYAQGPPTGPGYPPPPPAHQAPRRRHGCLSLIGGAVVAVILLVVVISVIAVIASGGDEDDGDGDTAGTETTAAGPETNSGNEENPPPEDLDGEPTCTTEAGLGPVARGSLTNHSSELSGYLISVGFLDAAGTRVAEGTTAVNNVQPDQTANWEAPAFAPDVQFATCEVVSIERLAA